MFEAIEKAILTGMGVLSLTEKKTEELLGEIKKKCDLSEEEGKALLEKVRQSAKDNQQKLEEVAREEIRKACDRMGVVPRQEFDSLGQRLVELEKRIALLETRMVK